MKENLQAAINLWYREWLKTNDPYTADIDPLEYMQSMMDDSVKLTLSTSTNEILVLVK